MIGDETNDQHPAHRRRERNSEKDFYAPSFGWPHIDSGSPEAQESCARGRDATRAAGLVRLFLGNRNFQESRT